MVCTIFMVHMPMPRKQIQEDGKFQDSQGKCPARLLRQDSFNFKI